MKPAECTRRADPQKTLRAAQERLDRRLGGVDLGRNPRRVRINRVSGFGEAELARGAIEEPRGQCPLEPGHVLACGRSRHTEAPRRGRETAGLHDLGENQHIERIEHACDSFDRFTQQSCSIFSAFQTSGI